METNKLSTISCLHGRVIWNYPSNELDLPIFAHEADLGEQQKGFSLLSGLIIIKAIIWTSHGDMIDLQGCACEPWTWTFIITFSLMGNHNGNSCTCPTALYPSVLRSWKSTKTSNSQTHQQIAFCFDKTWGLFSRNYPVVQPFVPTNTKGPIIHPLKIFICKLLLCKAFYAE